MLQEIGGGGPPLFVSPTITRAFSWRKTSGLILKRFVSHEHLEKSVFAERRGFMIRCDIAVFPPSSTGSNNAIATSVDAPQRSIPLPESSSVSTAPALQQCASGLQADLGRLLQTKEGADVEVEVHGQLFAAHKVVLAAHKVVLAAHEVVLAARSTVFKEEFFGHKKEETTSYIRISDLHPKAFNALLHYMYTDTLPEMPVLSSREEGPALAEELLVAADLYNLKDLKPALLSMSFPCWLHEQDLKAEKLPQG
ncbi:hypothetical protein QOZ80_7BG0586010 [Eleusine coracana subsp. coracana]|nr:hypothetical protein QOZ80_7BG0586010 [Eleusine coracana subsp. coracana]